MWLQFSSVCFILLCTGALGYLPAKPTPKLEWNDEYDPNIFEAGKRQGLSRVEPLRTAKRGYLPVKSKFEPADLYDIDEEKRMIPGPSDSNNYGYDTGLQETVNCRRTICGQYHSKPMVGICIQPHDFHRVCCNNSACPTAKDPYLHSLGCDRILQHHCGLYFTRIRCTNEGAFAHHPLGDCPFCLDLTDGTICTPRDTGYPDDSPTGTARLTKLSWYAFLIVLVPLSIVCCCFLLRRKCTQTRRDPSTIPQQQQQQNNTVVSNDIVTMDVQYLTRVQVNRGFLPDFDSMELAVRSDNPPTYAEVVSPPTYEEAIKLQQIPVAQEIFSVTK